MNIKKILAGGAASAMLSVSMLGVASAANFSNGSFELGFDPGVFSTLNANNSSSIKDWTVSSGSVDYIGSYWTASNGNRSLDMSGDNAGSVSKTFTTDPGETYTVYFDMAGNPDEGPDKKEMSVSAGSTSSIYSFNSSNQTRTNMGWVTKSFSFVATPSTTLTFTSLTNGRSGPALDNVRLVPELTDKNQCKKGGYKIFLNQNFKNQGDCVSFVQASENATGNRKDNTN